MTSISLTSSSKICTTLSILLSFEGKSNTNSSLILTNSGFLTSILFIVS